MSTVTATLANRSSAAPGAPDSAAGWWLFSATIDLSVFLGSALVALAALAIGARLGVLNGETPNWAWVPAVLMIDVAHVWATAFRVYFVPRELNRRLALYLLVPVLGYVAGVALYSEGELVFWRVLAYLAVFHFIRQQYGWVALYRARLRERGPWGRWIDTATIYLATIYPLIYWHVHLPRQFDWFMEEDFVRIPDVTLQIVRPLYWAVMLLYAGRSLWAWYQGRPNPGKDIVVATTAVCWYLGIVAMNSDYAFTITNVIIHGVPYLALVYWYALSQRKQTTATRLGRLRFLIIFLATIWMLAYAEELLWDRGIWHQRRGLFGPAFELGSLRSWIVPLLALPQLTHYILDGFVWRRKSNPDFSLVPRG